MEQLEDRPPPPSAFDDLPTDQYGVFVADEVDAIRLKWLVDEIGETKLRRSVAKYKERYPDSQPYVSRLLKAYNRKVPPKLFTSVPVPVYWVYLLKLRCDSKFKVGMTGRWPFRTWDFVRKANEYTLDRERLAQTFNLDVSQAWLVGGNKIEAKRREDAIKEALEPWRVESPWKDGYINFGPGGHKEWFDASQWTAAVCLATSFESDATLPSQTLAEAIDIALRDGDPRQSQGRLH